MKIILFAILSFAFTLQGIAQDNFIQIETNKTLALFSFMETSSSQQGISRSFRNYILDSLMDDANFEALIDSYSNLKLKYSLKRKEFPEKRAPYFSTKDMLWIAASNSSSIDDFDQRIIGYLPHLTHVQLIKILKEAEGYYNDLVWNKEQQNIQRIENQLGEYTQQISDLFLKISQFYNTPWSTNVPFKVMLYPIPLDQGYTTAIPMGNALICSFLSHNKNDYKSRLGIIIHEMCHILYSEQNADLQTQIDQWFTESDSPYAPLAYTFINEGLASTLGNGWAYKQIHGELDTTEWYHNEHIDGFAHALLPLCEQYLNEGKSIDQKFVNQSIQLFSETFPQALNETAILMNNLDIFSNNEDESSLNHFFSIHNYFNIRSMGISSPIWDPRTKDKLDKQETTKLFIVDSNNSSSVKAISKYYSQRKVRTPLNSIDIFKDEKSMSRIIIINIENLAKLEDAFRTLGAITYIKEGMNYPIK